MSFFKHVVNELTRKIEGVTNFGKDELEHSKSIPSKTAQRPLEIEYEKTNFQYNSANSQYYLQGKYRNGELIGKIELFEHIPADDGCYREHGFDIQVHKPRDAYEQKVGEYSGEVVNRMMHGNGKLQFIGSIKYGQNNFINLIGNNQILYKGEFKNNKFDGTGKLFLNGVLIYEGQFYQGYRHGNGILYHENGVIFEGVFSFDSFEKGIYTPREITGELYKYEGEFQNYEFHGHGVLSSLKDLREDLIYQGEWINGRPNGISCWSIYHQESLCLYDKDSDEKNDILMYENYEGEFKEGILFYNKHKLNFEVKINKQAFQYMSVECWNSEYGDYVNNRLNGYGVIRNNYNQIKYKGEFKDGLLHGKGMERLNISMYSRLELEDWERKLTTSYEGEFQEGLRHGYGKEIDSDGHELYKGQFNEDKYHGQGVLYDKKGKIIYEGSWLNDLYHGEGTLYSTDSRYLNVRLEGLFEKGLFIKGKKYDGELLIAQGTFHNQSLQTGKYYSYNSYYSRNLYINNLISIEIHEDGQSVYWCFIGKIDEFMDEKGYGFFVPYSYKSGKKNIYYMSYIQGSSSHVFFHTKSLELKLREYKYSSSDKFLIEAIKDVKGWRAIYAENVERKYTNEQLSSRIRQMKHSNKIKRDNKF